MTEDIEKLVQSLAKRAHSAARELAILDTGKKNAILGRIAELLEQSSGELVSQNEKDLRSGRENGLSEAMIDRLALTPKRIADMTEGVRQVIA